MVLNEYDRQARLGDEAGVQIRLDCYCHTCKLWHRPGPVTPDGFSQALWEWHAKHVGHDFEFLSPRRRLPRRFRDWVWQKLGLAPWWLEYGENTNFKLAFDAAAAITIGLGGLASSASFITGREAAHYNNTTSRYIDSEITARITTHATTAPTVNTEIRVYGLTPLNPDTPTWPDVFTGNDANVTLTASSATQILEGGIKPLLGATAVSATANIAYPIACLSTAQAWGKEPKRWSLYVTQSTGQTLHATAGNHVLTRTPAYLTDT